MPLAAPSAPQRCRARPALRRIAFLLERRQAETFKVKAFRRAAATLLALTPAELDRPGRRRVAAPARGDRQGHRDGRARRVRRQRPAYLADLERTAGPLEEGGRGAPRRLRGDLHTHSDWSDGGSPIEEMVMTAVELGHDYLALTDHSPRLKIANGLSVARLRHAARGRRRGQHPPRRRLPAAARHRGRHPRRRRPRPDRGDAGPARRRRGLGALQAADGARAR